MANVTPALSIGKVLVMLNERQLFSSLFAVSEMLGLHNQKHITLILKCEFGLFVLTFNGAV